MRDFQIVISDITSINLVISMGYSFKDYIVL